MENQMLPDDFKEFLRLLNGHKVEYLLIGGYAVGYHGYPRTTADIDIWVAINPETAEKLVSAFHDFGMRSPEITKELFTAPGNIVRMGMAPVRIEVLNEIDGVQFDECFSSGTEVEIDGIPIKLISLADLRKNKLASGRHKDLDDLEHLPVL
ncbi:MAG: nucleotidyltransferase [Pontiella sp.]